MHRKLAGRDVARYSRREIRDTRSSWSWKKKRGKEKEMNSNNNAIE